MASSSRTNAPRETRPTRKYAAPAPDFSDDDSSYESEDDSTSVSSSDGHDVSTQPGTSAAAHRVRTSLGQDVLPPAAKKLLFTPRRPPGAHLGPALRSSARHFTTARDFFLLFFTAEVISNICKNTNKYAWMHILELPSYAERDGSWKEVTPDELVKFIGLLIYMGIVNVPRIHLYWNTSRLFSGLVPRNIMPRRRFSALLRFLSVTDPEATTVASHGKLHRILWLLEHMNTASAELFQPARNLSVDERMVKSKGRSGIRQYMRDKIVKWGYKLWVLADSQTGYSIQFYVYAGKRETPSASGLAFDVVTQLCNNYLEQGYVIYMDNFYTSASLFAHLLEHKTLACGTTRKDRRCFPAELKDMSWEKKAKRGDVRWLRQNNILYLQWKDKKVVHMMSTAHTANKHVSATRKERRGGVWSMTQIEKPLLIDEYNSGMLGVDKSDQLIASYNVLMKCVRWWKTLFFHCIDIAVVNSFILFQEHRQQHLSTPEFQRGANFDQLSFRMELTQQLLGLDDEDVPREDPVPKLHLPQKMPQRRNCRMCYEERKVEPKTNVLCEECGVHLCITKTRNCFTAWHER
ncbi:piggyBac transposable element-derived protein 4-like [Dermacentor silvarum]|uniref:piggyBac transposable element-derived protein 4-like n=1 Tax=Dermacentor silvarum TaxID=543639 RepID=UPI0021018748|nr:piggyBac transposable element-derived protein 4-like [Dermacentor silvarum]